MRNPADSGARIASAGAASGTANQSRLYVATCTIGVVPIRRCCAGRLPRGSATSPAVGAVCAAVIAPLAGAAALGTDAAAPFAAALALATAVVYLALGVLKM